MHGAIEVNIALKSGTYDKIHLANTEHNDQTRNDDSCSSQEAAPDIACGSVAHIE